MTPREVAKRKYDVKAEMAAQNYYKTWKDLEETKKTVAEKKVKEIKLWKEGGFLNE